jgi:hypothetical protein
MATLYYNDAQGSADWANLQSWWTDPDCNIPATSLPTAADNVVLSGSASSNSSGSTITVANLEMNDPSENALYLELNITVTGTATFNSIVANNGPITGNAVFNDSADNYGPITGNATFNDYASNGSLISGNATFNGYSINNFGSSVLGDATFNDTAVFAGGDITGTATLYDYASVDGSVYVEIASGMTLNDYATANGGWYWSPLATFNDHASLTGQYNTIKPCVFNDHATCSGLRMSEGATFNGFSVCSAVGVEAGGIFTFNDSSTGGLDVSTSGFIPGLPDVIYNDKSYGSGQAKTLSINGAAVMQNANLNGYNPVLNYSFTRPQYGINGSSILGVI